MVTADELSRFPVFAGLDDRQRSAIAEFARVVRFPAGHRLFDEGGSADRCWLIRSGEVALDTLDPATKRRVIQTLGPTDVLGLSWLVPPYRWHFGAVALDDVEAIELDAAAMRAVADRDCSLGYQVLLKLFEALLTRLQGTRARVLDLYGSTRER